MVRNYSKSMDINRFSCAKSVSHLYVSQKMKSNFEIDQTIALEVEGSYFDLHNCFDFIGYEYRPTVKEIRCEWTRSAGDWVSPELPKELSLLFEGVTNFSAQRRDDEMPFSEDECISSISFLPPELKDEFDAVCPDYRSEEEHGAAKPQPKSEMLNAGDALCLTPFRQAQALSTSRRAKPRRARSFEMYLL